MTWPKFMIFLGVLYGLYYTGLIVWDIVLKNRGQQWSDTPTLIFEEEDTPQRVGGGETTVDPKSSPVVASGGVQLKKAFNLCLEEAIEFTRAVSF